MGYHSRQNWSLMKSQLPESLREVRGSAWMGTGRTESQRDYIVHCSVLQLLYFFSSLPFVWEGIASVAVFEYSPSRAMFPSSLLAVECDQALPQWLNFLGGLDHLF